MEVTTVADVFAREWVARFGVPAYVTTDRGTKFSSSTWSGQCENLGVEQIITIAYHPQANGMVEHSHRQLKNALRALLAASEWLDHLPRVLLGLRSAPKEESGISSAELVFGHPLSLPFGFVDAVEPPAVVFLEKMRVSKVPPPPTRPLSYAQVVSRPAPGLEEVSFVYVCRGGVGLPLAPLYAGPYEVIEK
jgi:hypothetical protein